MLARLQRLQQNMAQLRRFQTKYSAAGVMEDTHLEWALRYGLFEAVQIVIDVSCHLVTRDELGTPQTYGECIQLLQEHGYLPETLASTIKAMIGLRNILVHQYVQVDVGQLFELLNAVGDLASFIDSVAPHFAEGEGNP
ncbi:MAG: DUF86 domain-containing protein [Chloroflexia bacterium]|nr:DUF86 domain-containing protein [Chloroflexia bacterium]